MIGIEFGGGGSAVVESLIERKRGNGLDMRGQCGTITDGMRHTEWKQETNAVPLSGVWRFVSAKVESAEAVRPGYRAVCSYTNSRPSLSLEVDHG